MATLAPIQAKRCVLPSARKVIMETFEVESREPQEDEILVETHFSLVSSGTETAYYMGKDPGASKPPGSWGSFPWVAGYTAMGRVLRAGPNRLHLKPGDLVLSQSPHSSHSWVNYTHGTIVCPMPPKVDPRKALFARLAAISKTALDVSSVRDNDTVLVIGLGIIGNLAAQIFRERGARVMGLDLSPKRRASALQCRLSTVEDPGRDGGVKESMKKFFGPEGPRIVVEAVGDAQLDFQAMEYAKARDGEVIVLGTPRRPVPMDANDIFRIIHSKGVRVVGAHEYLLPRWPDGSGITSAQENMAQMAEWIESGKLEVAPLLTQVLPPESLQEAYEGLENKKEEYIAVALDWGAKKDEN